MSNVREVLTNEEITAIRMKVFGSGLFSNEAGRQYVRAVERAVLEKLDGYVTPAEARERERRAFQGGVEIGLCKHLLDGPSWWERHRDFRYPSMTPPKPEGVTLSDGTRWWLSGGYWLVRHWDGSWGGNGSDKPSCRIAEDFEAVARYLREIGT